MQFDALTYRVQEAEDALLGLLINNPSSFYDVDVSEHDFYGASNRAIFKAISEQVRKTGKVSLQLIATDCRRDVPEITERLMTLAEGGIIGLSGILGLSERVLDASAARAAAREYMEYLKRADGEPTASDVRELGARICEASGRRSGDGFVSLGDFAASDKAAPAQPGEFFFPLPLFEDVVPTLQPGQIVVIGGRPGDGKSAYLNHVMAASAEDSGVAVFSYEMTCREIWDRLLAHAYEMDHGSISRGHVVPSEYERNRADAASRFGNVWIEDCHDVSVDLAGIEARLTRLCARRKIRAVCIDYIQLIPTSAKHSERVQELSRMTARLKQLAKRLGVVIFELAQLNRDSVKADREPTIADLKESGSIEQDANVIVLIHRTQGGSRLLLRKNRGGVGHYNLAVQFQGSMMRFVGMGEAEPGNKSRHGTF